MLRGGTCNTNSGLELRCRMPNIRAFQFNKMLNIRRGDH